MQWCEGRVLTPGVHLLPEESIGCPRCRGMLYHDGEFRTVVCVKATKAPETVKQMFKQILFEKADD